MELMKFEFNNQLVEFDPTGTNIMVNATQMAKIFDAKVNHFLENDGTRAFIKACLNNRNSGFLKVEKEEDLVTSKQKSGTWMHRVLALKFAAWLSPDFEVWVYMTIDFMLFGHYQEMEQSLKESALRRNRINELVNLLRDNEAFLELETLELTERQSSYRRGKKNRQQLEMFRDHFFNERIHAKN